MMNLTMKTESKKEINMNIIAILLEKLWVKRWLHSKL